MYLLLALALFLCFVGNVLAGSLGGAPVVGDVGEMLLLFGASIAFVAAIERAKRRARAGTSIPAPPATTDEGSP